MQKTLSQGFGELSKLFRSPRRWIKGSYSKTKDGTACYCLMGGVYNTIGRSKDNSARTYLRQAIKDLYPRQRVSTIEGWNDSSHRTIDQIRKVVSRARKLALADEKAA